MALLDDVKVVLRVDHDVTDSEIENLIADAVFDMANKGVSTTWLGTDPMDTSFTFDDIDEDALPVKARRLIALYAKANYGYDNDDADRLTKSYDSHLCSLLNSQFNAVYDEDEED